MSRKPTRREKWPHTCNSDKKQDKPGRWVYRCSVCDKFQYEVSKTAD